MYWTSSQIISLSILTHETHCLTMNSICEQMISQEHTTTTTTNNNFYILGG